MIHRATTALLLRSLCIGFLTTLSYAQVSVLTQHNDTFRSGQNLQETQLNRSNVNVNQFGKLFTQPVDGQIYAQPLYVPNVSIPGRGTHNVVYVATMNDSVYAFDADNNTGANSTALWSVNFTNPAAGITAIPSANVQPLATDITGPIGIESTPVIDPSTGTLYVLARTLENGAYFQRLHALDITTGAEKFGGPAVINASVTTSSGTVKFDPMRQNQRCALGLANGRVYIVWASHNDYGKYYGWVIAYNATTLAQTAAFIDTPSGGQGGIWQAGQAPAFDSSGNLYLSTGNGIWDGVQNFGSSILKLSPSLSVLDWFTPDNYSYLNANDLDLGSSGPLLVPNSNTLLTGGKPGILFLLSTSGLGNFANHNAQVPQTLLAANGHIHGSPIYWNSPSLGPLIYMQSEFDYLKAFSFNGSTLVPVPVSQSIIRVPDGMPGGFLSVSSNGSASGTGIVWASTPLNGDANHQTVQGIVRAYNAEDLTQVLWDTQQNASRDDIGNFAKFVPPTVANGKVYMATFSNQVAVYGLLSGGSDFSLTALPSSQSVAPGASVPYSVSVGDLQGQTLTGAVTFSISGLPAGVTAAFSPASVGTRSSTNLTVTAGSGAATGTYSLKVTGSSGSASHSVTLTLTVSAQASGIGPGTNVDIGAPGSAGSGTFSNGTYTVSGSGADVWGNSDQFHFTYWQFAGDGTFVARIVSPANTGFYSKSGVMFRGSLDANASYAFLANMPSIYGLQYRNVNGANSATTPYFTPSYPQWVKMVRANGNFTGFVSADGKSWTQVGDPVSVVMGQTAYVGLAVTSQTNASLGTATFDNVSLSPGVNSSADFTISAPPASYPSAVLAGNAVAVPISVQAFNGFNGAVGFSVNGLPSGANFIPTGVTGAGAGSVLLETSANTPTGTFPVTIVATSGTLKRDITLNLNVGNFAISPTPASQTVTAGGTAAYTIGDTDANGYSGLATLSISGLPTGATAYFEPAAVDRIVTSTLTLSTASATPAGTYNLTVTGTSNTQARSTTVQLVVQAAAGFSLRASPGTQTVAAGGTASYTVSSTAAGGFNGSIALSASGLPSGATAGFSPATITGSGSSTLSVQTNASTPAGSYTIAVTGKSGSLTQTSSVTLVVSGGGFGSGAGTDVDIASPALAGSASVSGGVYTVKGAGIDIWYGSDQFNFNYWPMTADGILTARVVSVTNTAQYAKAGIMIRQSLSPNSQYAFVEASPSLYSFHYRTVPSNYASGGAYLPPSYPMWIRLARANGNFNAYSSPDGKTWTKVNQTVSVPMTGTVYAGLAVTSQNPGALNTAVFDNVSFVASPSSVADFTLAPTSTPVVTVGAGQSAKYSIAVGAVNSFAGAVNLTISGLPSGATANFSPATVTGAGSVSLTVQTSVATPPGWYALTVTGTGGGLVRTTSVTLLVQNAATGSGTDVNIGSPAIAGSASASGGVFTVSGAGSDIWQASDQFNFNYWPVTGDATITARVKSITNTNFYAKAGVMIRESLNPNSTFAFAVAIPTLFNFHYRLSTAGSAASGPYFNVSYPMWLRLVRSGTTFTAYSSPDGQAWTQINSPVSINMASPAYVGLAVTSHDVTKLNTAVFDNVVITQP